MTQRNAIAVACPLAVFLLAAAMPAMPASPAGDINTERLAPKSAVLYDFGTIGDSKALPEGFAKQACTKYATPTASGSGKEVNPPTREEAVQLTKGVNDQLAARLSKKLPVTIAKAGETPPQGALV